MSFRPKQYIKSLPSAAFKDLLALAASLKNSQNVKPAKGFKVKIATYAMQLINQKISTVHELI